MKVSWAEHYHSRIQHANYQGLNQEDSGFPERPQLEFPDEDQKVALKDIGTELEKKTDNKPVTGETYLPPGGLRGKSIRGK